MDGPSATELLVSTQRRIAELRKVCEESKRLCSELSQQHARLQDSRAKLNGDKLNGAKLNGESSAIPPENSEPHETA
jgi:hypothetical protein